MQLNSPLVSIITVSYNSERFIEHNILSVLKQDYPNIEHIIIDGNSSDKTVEIIEKYNKIKYISESDNGITDAYNKGIKLSSGSIISFLNSDDVFYDNKAIINIVNAMHENPSVGIVFGDFAQIDLNNKLLSLGIGGGGKKYDYKDLLCSKYTIPLPSAFVTKEAIDSFGDKLDESLDLASDWELWAKIGLAYKVLYIPKVIGCGRKFSGEVKFTLQCAMDNPRKRRMVLDYIFSQPNLSKDIIRIKKKAYSGTYINQTLRLLGLGYFMRAIKYYIKAIIIYPGNIISGMWFYYLKIRLFPYIKKYLPKSLLNVLRSLKRALNLDIKHLRTSSSHVRWWAKAR